MSGSASWDAVARAISARDGVLRVSAHARDKADNRFREQAWPPDAPSAPYAVYLATGAGFRTVAFDIDLGGPAGDEQAGRLTRLLHDCGIQYVEAISGPSGHRHVLTTWETPVPATAVAAVARLLKASIVPALDLSPLTNPCTGCIRPPGSPHRRGGHSQLVDSTPAEALHVLRQGNSPDLFNRLRRHCAHITDGSDGADQRALPVNPPDPAQLANVSASNRPAPASDQDGQGRLETCERGHPKLRRPHRPLGPTTRALLTAPGISLVDNRSTVAYRVMVAAAFAGWTLSDIDLLVQDPANTCFDHLRRARTASGFTRRRRHDTTARTARMWRSAVHWAARQTPPCTTAAGAADAPATPRAVSPEVRELLRDIEAAALHDRSSWAGQGGPGRRVVLEELLSWAHRLGSTTVARSVRDLELATGLGKSSVARALAGLRSRGWLVTSRSGSPDAAGALHVADGVTGTHDRDHVADHQPDDTAPEAALSPQEPQAAQTRTPAADSGDVDGTRRRTGRLHRAAASHQLRLPDHLRPMGTAPHDGSGDAPDGMSGDIRGEVPGSISEDDTVAGGTLVSAPLPPVAASASGARGLASGLFRVGSFARSHDACTSDGLGRFAGLLLDLLTSSAASVAELAARACLNPRTVRDHLTRLASRGLARLSPTGQWEAMTGALSFVAADLGVSHVVARRQEQTRVERAAWAFWLADHHAERGWASRRGRRSDGAQSTADGAGCPALAFPTVHGRRVWRAGIDAVKAGLGLSTEQLDALDLGGQLPVKSDGAAPYAPSASATAPIVSEIAIFTVGPSYGGGRARRHRRQAPAAAVRRHLPGLRRRAAGEGRGGLRAGGQDRALPRPRRGADR